MVMVPRADTCRGAVKAEQLAVKHPGDLPLIMP